MYHIYLDEEAVNAFALRLAKSEHFRDGTYTLYGDVPVKCFEFKSPYHTTLANLNTIDAHTAAQTVDFVITSGTDVVLGITTEVMANKSKKLFEGALRFMPHIEVSSGGTPRQKYGRLYHQVRDELEAYEERDARTVDAQTGEPVDIPRSSLLSFRLTPYPVELSVQELKGKQLLNHSGYANAYGRAHGLFLRYGVGQDGSLEQYPVTSDVTSGDYLRAVNWEPADGETISFSALQKLLDTSIADLFRNHSEAWNELNDAMAELTKLRSYPSFAPCDILEDYPELVYRLRCRVDDSNEESRQIVKLTDKLLISIAEVLGDERTAERFEILRVPLQRYYEEAAVRSGLYYPNWLYNQSVRPFLNETQEFRGTHTLQDLLLHRGFLPEGTPCPDLIELFAAPLCTP